MEKNKMKSIALTLAVLFATLGVAQANTGTTADEPKLEEVADAAVESSEDAQNAEKKTENQ